MSKEEADKTPPKSPTERRENARVPCRFEIETKIGEKSYSLEAYNIGMGGIMVSAKSETEKLTELGFIAGKEVFLSFYFPNQDHLFKVSGEIGYIKRQKDPEFKKGSSCIGIKFKELSREKNEMLKSFFEQ